tara:strand:+ start:1339 stop:12039 length:10701 start_codon:yes stop_codon:yes gene_type:complete
MSSGLFTNSLSTVKASQLQTASSQKKSSLNQLTVGKQQALGPSAPSPEQYESLSAYMDAGLPVSNEVNDYYRLKELNDLSGNMRESREEKEKIDKNAMSLLRASYGVGSNNVVGSVGTLYGLATGDMDNPLRKIADEGRQYHQERKPYWLQKDEEARSAKVAEADGEWEKFKTVIAETASNPSLVASLLTETLPNLIPGAVVAKAAKVAAKGTQLTEKAIDTIATNASIVTSSAIHGSDAASGSYDTLKALPQEVWDADPEYQKLKTEIGAEAAKESIALSKARLAGAASGTVGFLTNKLPGGDILDKYLAGTSKKTATNFVVNAGKGLVGEAAQELAEEGSGKLISNAAVRSVDSSQELTEGVGEAAGLGLVGGGVLGGAAGAANSIRKPKLRPGQPPTGNAKAQDEAVETALKTGDVSSLVNKAQPETYNPLRAADVLAKRAENVDLPEVERTAAQTQLNTLVSDLQADKSALEAADPIESSLAPIYAQIKLLEEKAALPENQDPAIQESISNNLSAFRDMETSGRENPENLVRIHQQKIAAIDKTLTEVGVLTEQQFADTRLEPEQIDEVISQATVKEVTPESEQAVNQVINLAMRDPEALSDDQVQVISESTALNPEQREFFKAFSAANVAKNLAKDADGVTDNITNGADGFKGLNQYVAMTGKAIRQKDNDLVEAELTGLGEFQQHHSRKLNAIRKANEQLGDQTSGSLYIVQDPKHPDGYTIEKKSPWGKSKTARSENGGWIVHSSSSGRKATTSQIAKMDLEQKAMAGTEAQMRLMQDRAFNSTSEGTVNVDQEVTQTENETANVTEETAESVLDENEAVAASSIEGQPDNTTNPEVSVTTPDVDDANVVDIPGTTSEATPVVESPAVVQAKEKVTDLTTRINDIESFGEAPGYNEEQEAEVAQLKTELVAAEETADAFDQAMANVGKEDPSNGYEDYESWTSNTDLNPPSSSDVAVDQTVVEAKPVTNGSDTQPQTDQTPLTTEQELEINEARITEEELAATTEEESLFEETIETEPLTSGFNNEELQNPARATLEELKGSANLLERYFRHKAVKISQASGRPLVAIKNFMASIVNGTDLNPDLVNKVVTDQMTAEDTAALSAFAYWQGIWGPIIESNLNNDKNNRAFEYNELTKYFAEDQSIPENVKTAISYGIFTWVAENAGGDGTNNPEAINAILGRLSDAEVSTEETNLLTNAGSLRNAVANQIGQRIYDALGIELVPGSPESVKSQFVVALGGAGMIALTQKWVDSNGDIQRGFLEQKQERTAIFSEKDSDGQIVQQKNKDGEMVDPPLDSWMFVRIARADGVANEAALLIKDLHGKSRAFLDRLFGVEPGLVFPSDTAGVTPQKSINKSRRQAPKGLKEAGKAYNKHAYVDRPTMRKAQSVFSIENFAKIVGVRNKKYSHAALALPRQAKNNGYERDIEHLETYRNSRQDTPDAPFYLGLKFWSNQRAGHRENTINPQASKLHREAVGHQEWEISFDPKDNNSDQVKYLKLGIAAALGIKIDTKTAEPALEELKALVATEEVRAAIDILKTIENVDTTFDPALQQVVVDAVVGLDQDTAGLEGLLQYARYEIATETNSTFTTDIMLEVDGVNNGPALALIMLGQVTSLMGNRFGFYNKNSRQKSFPAWKEVSGHFDLYEVVAAEITSLVKSMRGVHSRFLVVGRKQIKTPLTALVFGSGIKASINSMAYDHISGLYESMEDIANGSLPDSEKLTEIKLVVAAYNTMLITKLKEPTSIKNAMELQMGSHQIKQFLKKYDSTVGKAVSIALKNRFGPFMESRRQLNMSAQGLWKRYQTAFDYLYAERLKALEDVATLTVEGKKAPLQELSREEIAAIREELRPIANVIHTPMSKAEGNLDAGLDVEKILFKAAEKAQVAYRQKLKPVTSIPYLDPKGYLKSSQSMAVSGNFESSEDPGVRTVIMLIHALDSAIASSTYAKVPSLNIHDALGTGIGHIVDAAKGLNENTYKWLTSYSLPWEITTALNKSFTNGKALTEKYPGLQEELDQIVVGYQNDPIGLSIHHESATKLALEMELSKLEYLSTVDFVNQYGFEDGVYEVTEKDRARLEQRLGILKGRIAAFSKAGGDVDSLGVELEPDRAESTHWGATGRSKNTNDRRLVEKLRKLANLGADVISPSIVLNILRENLEQSEVTKEMYLFRKNLIKQLTPLLSDKLKVRWITPQSEVQGNEQKQDGNYAWFSSDEKGNQTIGIKSPEFVDSNVTSETLLHEFIHAALAPYVNRLLKLKKVPASQRAALEVVKELETLRQLAETYINKNKLEGYGPAIKNVDELIAWGLSNTSFQTEVLAKIILPAPTGVEASVESALNKFIGFMAELIWGKKANDGIKTGLGLLIVNSSKLIDATLKNQNLLQKTVPLNMPMAAPDPMTYSSEQVFEALGKNSTLPPLDPAHSARLVSMMKKVVSAVYNGSVSAEQEAERSAPVTTDDVYLKALVSGKKPYVNEAADQLRMTKQEEFALELVEASMTAALSGSYTIQRELREMFRQVKRKVKPEDLPPGAYDAIFTAKNDGKNASTYLARFIAASLVYKPLNDVLTDMKTEINTKSALKATSVKEALGILFEQLVNFLNRMVTKTYEGQNYSGTIQSLAENVASIKTKHKVNLSREASGPGALMDLFDESTGKFATKVADKVEEVARSEFLRKSKLGIVKGAAGVVATVAGGRSQIVMDLILKMRNRSHKRQQGVAASVLTEVMGATDKNAVNLELLNEGNAREQSVMRTMLDISNTVISVFKVEPNKAQAAALTEVLRSDMSALGEHYTVAELEQLLSDPKVRAAAIAKWEAQIATDLNQMNLDESEVTTRFGYYSNQAKYLAHNMVTGKVYSENLMMNAETIAGLAKTSRKGSVTVADSKTLVKSIDPLVSLYALEYMASTTRTTLVDVFRQEANRDAEEGNGIEYILALHSYLKKDALENEFQGIGTHMIKGHTSEIYDPHVELVAATPLEGEALLAAGYSKLDQDGLLQDDADPTGTRSLYTLRGRGLSETVSGVISWGSLRAKGYKINNSVLDLASGEVKRQSSKLAGDISKAKEASIEALFTHDPDLDPRKLSMSNKMVPVLNQNGDAVNYRYLMESDTKDRVLVRDNRFNKVLGHMAGTAINKNKAPLLNKDGIQTLYEQSKAEYAKDPDAFITIGPNSTDPELQERYRLLPEKTKRDIRKIWGSNEMRVRNDVYNVMFGYRKHSIGDMFKKIAEDRSRFETVVVWALTNTPIIPTKLGLKPMGETAALRIVQLENAWQEIVRVVKDIWVIKNLVTLIGNEFSNYTVLALYGVSPIEYVKMRVTGQAATSNYLKDRKARDKLQLEINIGILKGKALTNAQQEVIILNDTLEKNPVHVLMDSGLYQTVAEDLATTDEDPFSYRSKLTEGIEAKTAFVPAGVKTVAKNLLLMHGTPGYDLLNQATIRSDFAARFVLHEHLTQRKKDPVDSKEAIKTVRAAFVNYDVPTHKGLQYINDMGFLPFTKYYLRIQVAIFQAVKSNPGRAAALLAIGDMFGGLPHILESSLINDPVPGSLSMGALELPGSVKEILPIKMLMSAF